MKTIKKISAESTYFIRREILRDGMNVSVSFEGDTDENTFHLGAFYNEELVGIATFMENTCDVLIGKQYQLRGMATLPKVRGLGFGSELLIKAVEVLRQKQVTHLWCNARKIAVPFYEKNGFEVMSDFFEIPEVGTHCKMGKIL